MNYLVGLLLRGLLAGNVLRGCDNVFCSGLVKVIDIKSLYGLSVVHFLIPAQLHDFLHVLRCGVEGFEVRTDCIAHLVNHGLGVVGEFAKTTLHH